MRPDSLTRLLLFPVLALAADAVSAQAELGELESFGLSPREAAAVQQAMELGRQISEHAEEKNGAPFRRDAHAKATGCARAIFEVNGDIPERYRHGVFATPARAYPAWVRFSNGDMLVQADDKPDARGMAVKLMGVEGERIAPELPASGSQDFIATNTEAFFHRNIFDYTEDMAFLARLERTRWFISLFPPRLHPKQFYRAIQTVSSKIDNPLQPQYFSMLPYRLGTSIVKFSFRACPGMSFREAPDKSASDYLTVELEHSLQTGGACFDLLVQPQVNGSYMPIDDATVIWSQEASPFVPIARMSFPPQSIEGSPLREFCEDLSMNPWHGIADWEPLSSLGIARRAVYRAVSIYRHRQNGVTPQEPTSWCLPGDTGACDEATLMHGSPPPGAAPRYFDPLYRPLAEPASD